MFELGSENLTVEQLVELSSGTHLKVKISDEAFERLDLYRNKVEQKLGMDTRFYGINTGFGYLSDITIENDQRLWPNREARYQDLQSMNQPEKLEHILNR